MRRVLLRIEGRVQGVGFRAFLRDEALRLSLRGWVRNAPDGSVAARVEGEDAAVEALIAWLRKLHQPLGPHVDSVEIDEKQAVEEDMGGGFSIVR